jgi:hypothetical protein
MSVKAKVASGCGAITAIRPVTERPDVSALTMKADTPLAPGASPVRAKRI